MDKIISSIKQRILFFIENQSINRSKFFLCTDISSSNFKGPAMKSEIGGDMIVKILTNYPELNSEWLMTGNGEMLKSDILPYHKVRADEKLNKTEDVPVYHGNTTAGIVHVYNDEIEQQKPVGTLNATFFPGCDHAEKVTGDSMYPIIINQGLIVGKIVDKAGIIWGEKYGVHTKFGLNVAKFIHPSSQTGFIKLVSYNKCVPEQEIPIDDIVFCFRILYIINPA